MTLTYCTAWAGLKLYSPTSRPALPLYVCVWERDREMVGRCCLRGVTHLFKKFATEYSMDVCSLPRLRMHTHTVYTLSPPHHTCSRKHGRGSTCQKHLVPSSVHCSRTLFSASLRRHAARRIHYNWWRAARQLMRGIKTCLFFPLLHSLWWLRIAAAFHRFCSVHTYRRRSRGAASL